MRRISDGHLVWGCILALSIVVSADIGRDRGRKEAEAACQAKAAKVRPTKLSQSTKCTSFLITKEGYKQCQWWKRLEVNSFRAQS